MRTGADNTSAQTLLAATTFEQHSRSIPTSTACCNSLLQVPEGGLKNSAKALAPNARCLDATAKLNAAQGKGCSRTGQSLHGHRRHCKHCGALMACSTALHHSQCAGHMPEL